MAWRNALGFGRAGPWLVFAVALGLTAAAVWLTVRASRERDVARFEHQAEEAAAEIEERLAVYVAILRAGAALMDASEHVSRAEFRTFVQRLHIEEDYPGIRAIGWAVWLDPGEAPAVIAAARADGLTTFTVRPDAESAVLYIEPLDAMNQRALGFDMAAEPARRAAMARARDTGLPAMSGKVHLVQEVNGAPQPGFLVYVPVYTGGGVPETTEARRATLAGFVYAPLRADDFIRGVFARAPSPAVSFAVYDGDTRSPDAILGRHGLPPPRALRHVTRLETGGHIWTLVFASPESPSIDAAVGLGLGGLVFSVALLLVSRGQVAAQAQVAELNATLERRVADRTLELQEAVRELEAFSYTVSHDLRAPLRHIVGYTELATQELVGPCARQMEYVERAREAALRGGQLVDDLLLFSRIGRVELARQPIDMNALLADVRAQLEPELKGRSVTWRVDPLPTVEGDPTMLRQALLNLVANALKFTRPRPDAVIEVRCAERPEEWVFSVRDNGLGFDPAHAERLFGVFERLHPDFEGTGIGTAIVRRVVTRHGGKAWAHAEVNQGATFSFTLPRSP